MEEIITWLKELIITKGFKMLEPEMIWYNGSYSISIEIDYNDNLIIGRPIDNIYTVFKLDEENITKELILDELNYYIKYYINKNFGNFKI